MAIQNSNGTFSNLNISCRRIESLDVNCSLKVRAELDAVDMHQVFQQLTAEQIVNLLPDMTTVIDVYNLTEQLMLNSKAA